MKKRRKGNIIDAKDRFYRKMAPAYVDAIDMISGMHPDDRVKIVAGVATVIMLQVDAGLGLIDFTDEEVEMLESLGGDFFEEIDKRYQQAAAGCYFCDDSIDPNAVPYVKGTKICLICKLKLENFLRAIGINPAKVFRGKG